MLRRLSNVEVLPDPCPLPEHLAEKKRHKLNARERVIYAPMSDVGGLVYDKDATFVDIGPAHTGDAQNPRQALLHDLKTLAAATLAPPNATLARLCLSGARVANEGAAAISRAGTADTKRGYTNSARF
jgi:hypothetical protein